MLMGLLKCACWKVRKVVPLCNFARGTLYLIVSRLCPTPLGPFLPPAVCLARLLPRPRNLLIKFYAYSVTCLDTISPALVSSVDLLSAISVRILPPVSNVSRPTTLDPHNSIGWTQLNRLKQNCRSRVLAEFRRERSPGV